MPFCRECGKEIQDDWKTCPFCSASIGAQTSSVTVQDGVIAGDVTVNNLHDIKEAMGQLLAEIGFTKDSSPDELTSEQTQQVEKVLEISEQLESHGIEIDPWTEITLGNAAKLAGRTHSAQKHYLRALETFRKNGDRQGEAGSLIRLGRIADTRGDLTEAERLHRESLAISREIGNRDGEAVSLQNLGVLSFKQGDLGETEQMFREGLAIRREISDREGEAMSLINLGRLVQHSKGQHDEHHRMFTEAVKIQREIGIPIDQWFIDNGY